MSKFITINKDKSIFDNIRTEKDRKKMVKEISNELYYNNEKNDIEICSPVLKKSKCYKKIIPDIKNKKIENISDFFCENESMLQAEFYHQCRLLDIPCQLEVNFQGGFLDAVINISNYYVILEFKVLKNISLETLITSNSLFNQLKTYRQLNLPIVLITKINDMCLILARIKNRKLRFPISY